MAPHSSGPTDGFLDAVDAQRIRLYACCGGQGTSNLTGLDDLIRLVHTYPDCAPLQNLCKLSSRCLTGLSRIPHRSGFFTGRGFPLQRWIEDQTSCIPPADELALAPYSFPINTLLTLAHYVLAAHTLNVDPSQLRDRLQGIVGHSQGLFAAAAIARVGSGWPSFYDAAELALRISFSVGLESHVAAPASRLSAQEVQDCLDHEEGMPSHLLSVTGLRPSEISRLIHRLKTNGRNDDEGNVHLALINGRTKCVLAGTPQGLRGVCIVLRQGSSKSRLGTIPDCVEAQFLPVSAPFHSPWLEPVERLVVDALGDQQLKGQDLAIPLHDSSSGQNLQTLESANILNQLVRSVITEPVDWPAVCHRMTGAATHVLALGPGAVGALVQDITEGSGLGIIPLSGRSLSSGLSSLQRPPPAAPRWEREYRPRLRNASQGQSSIETRMTRLLGLPPIMVAGMTPTTCFPGLVAAVTNAGYHVEFACGGYHRRDDMEQALRQLVNAIPMHRGITCNVIYASPKSLSWQIALLRNLIREGLPIEGLTVGAGIPSLEVVHEWMDSLRLRHIWFKPGSVDAIDRVLAIARQYPNFPIGLQWTGGRAGGHHSSESFHDPIMRRYGRIRQCANIVLVAGSGFGGAPDTWPYLTGSWSRSLGYAAMPFDGVLLGSRMMVAKEAKTSRAVKQLIVEAPGIEDEGEQTGAWMQCVHKPVGGIISVSSEMGQPIHVLATRAMRLWHDFDRRFFSIRDRQKLVKALQQHRDEIIVRLNQDYARPWFATLSSRESVELVDLNYRQVLSRLCDLMYVVEEDRWIHDSYLCLIHDFLDIVRVRFARRCSPLPDHPSDLLATFDATFGEQGDQILYPEDAARLLALFRRPAQKPVPFIPILDADFETWFKKDSLWQSEDIMAVPGHDPQRVCIIQGPVAARHSTVCDEPVALILDRIRDSHLEMLRQEGQEGYEAEEEESHSSDAAVLPGVRITQQGSLIRYHLTGPALPSAESLAERLVGDCAWAQGALLHPQIIYGRSRVTNPIRDAFQPGVGDVVEVHYANDRLTEVTLYTAPLDESSKQPRAALELAHHREGEVTLTLLPSPAVPGRPPLELTMRVAGGPMRHPLLQVDHKAYLERVRRLYMQLWIPGPSRHFSSTGLNSEFVVDGVSITVNAVRSFLDVIRQTGPARCRAWDAHGPVVPLDYAVVLAWTVLVKPVLLPALDAEPLQLLHQSISVRLVPGVRPLHVGDVVMTTSRITERRITPAGQLVEVSGDIYREGEVVVRIKTVFVIQRPPPSKSPQQQFRSVNESDLVLHVSSPVQLQVLTSRKWFILEGSASDLLGKSLVFRLTTQTVYDGSGVTSSLDVAGSVSLLPEGSLGSSFPSLGPRVGRVYFEDEGTRGNPVADFLARHATPRIQRQDLANPGWTGDASIAFTAPSRSAPYAGVSGDPNPIHLCPLLARFAGRSQPVLHGMHLSAVVRRIVEWMIGDSDRTRFRSWKASFESIVRADSPLRVELQHRAMEEGLMVIEVQVIEQSLGDRVMLVEATVEQAPTAYLFCGQGSQEKGMGMGLYRSHRVAQAVWDRADEHFLDQYGFSLLDIVRDNPPSLTVHFGASRGQAIRANYLSMTHGSDSSQCILPGLTPESRSYTFTFPAGLLMSTQFAQPALAVMEMAEYAYLQAQGVVQSDAPFAGHSLGEYSALGACTTFMPFEALLSLILYRGLRMQNALPRDENGRTGFAMVAADPTRIKSDFGEPEFIQLVEAISKETGVLLEVVNYNVQSRQYVCAGQIRALWVLGEVCNQLSESAMPTYPETQKECISRHTIASQTLSAVQLTRGRATVPLNGVDIPFHSKMLREHIDDYRQFLRAHVNVSDIKPKEFVGRWIPNVVGEPFALDEGYIRRVQEITGTEHLGHLV